MYARKLRSEGKIYTLKHVETILDFTLCQNCGQVDHIWNPHCETEQAVRAFQDLHRLQPGLPFEKARISETTGSWCAGPFSTMRRTIGCGPNGNSAWTTFMNQTNMWKESLKIQDLKWFQDQNRAMKNRIWLQTFFGWCFWNMGWVDGPCRPERDLGSASTGNWDPVCWAMLGPWRPFFVAKGKVSKKGRQKSHQEPGLLFHSQVTIGKNAQTFYTILHDEEVEWECVELFYTYDSSG